MKKAFLLAGFASTLLACNTNTNNNTGKHDSSNHATHNETSSTSKNQMNPVSATMDKMMHKMHDAKPTGNNDFDFAAMMFEHHKGAVEMSKVEIAKGQDDELKAFAQKGIDDQNKEITFMQEFISKAPKRLHQNSADFQNALNGPADNLFRLYYEPV